jgi:exoribonuclease R
MMDTRPSRCLIRSLTQVRNRVFQSRGAQIKEQETYLRRVEEAGARGGGGGRAAAVRTADQLDVLLSRMGRQNLLKAGRRRRRDASAASAAAAAAAAPAPGGNDPTVRKFTGTVGAFLHESDGEAGGGSDPFFIVPATDMLYLSFLDLTEAMVYLNGKCLFLETDLLAFRRTAKQFTQSRIEDIQNDPQMTCVFFSNEHCANTSVLPIAGRCEEDRSAVATATAVAWLQSVLDGIALGLSNVNNHKPRRTRRRAAKLVLLTENAKLTNAARSAGVRHCCTCQELLDMMAVSPRLSMAPGDVERLQRLAKELLSEKERKVALAQATSKEQRDEKTCDALDASPALRSWWKTAATTAPGGINASEEEGNPLDEPSEYYDDTFVSVGLRDGILFRGTLDHSAHVAMEAWLNLETGVLLDAATGERSMSRSRPVRHRILIKGRGSVNRALHGDEVVVRLLPKEFWSVAESGRTLSDNSGAKSRGRRSATHQQRGEAAAGGAHSVPSGRVVYVVKPGHRQFVATLQLDAHDIESLELEPMLPANTAEGGSAAPSMMSSSLPSSSRERFILAVPMNRRIPKIRLRTRQLGTLAGQRLVVSLDGWRVGSTYPDGHFVRSLGAAGNLSTEAAALLLEHRLEDHARPFSISALAELPRLEDDSIGAQWSVPASEVSRRRDFRQSRRVVSIDPPGCMDIDDALSVHALPNGNVEVGVHIADVTAFVAQGSPLDTEALHRGTSVYLVDRRLDMLPGLLSTNLCSLLCGTDRLAMSVLWELQVVPGDESEKALGGASFQVLPERTWFGRTIIRSSYALSYGQAQRIIDGKPPGSGNPNAGTPLPRGTCGGDVATSDEPWLRQDITMLRDIGRWLLRRRQADGAVSFDSAEIKFKLDKATGQPTSVKAKKPLEVHSTIEEMMVFANSTVAEKIDQTFPGAAFLRRHAEPDPRKAEQLNGILAGLEVESKKSNSGVGKTGGAGEGRAAKDYRMLPDKFSANLSKAVASSKSIAVRRLVKNLAVKAMSEAKYFCTGEDRRRSPIGGGEMGGASMEVETVVGQSPHRHYGLGVCLYTHFTSPIRRYADVVVHRLLVAALDPSPSECVPFSAKTMIAIANHLNDRNREAKYAGGDSRALFLALHLRRQPEVVDAVVSGLRSNGFLAFVPKYGIRVPVRIVDDYDQNGNARSTFASVTGTLNLGTLEGQGVADASGWSVQTVPADEANVVNGISSSHKSTLQILAPGGKVWRELAMMDPVRVELCGDRVPTPGRSHLADISFRAPKVRALLVSHVRARHGGGGKHAAAASDAGMAAPKTGHGVVNKEVEDCETGERRDSSQAGQALSSSPLYSAISACKENTKSCRMLCHDMKGDAAQKLNPNAGVFAVAGRKVRPMEVQPWKHKRQHANNGRRMFGGWSSMQPFRVGLGGRGSTAPPLFSGLSGAGGAQSKAEGVASNQKKLKKIEADVTRRMRKLHTKKRESRRK